MHVDGQPGHSRPLLYNTSTTPTRQHDSTTAKALCPRQHRSPAKVAGYHFWRAERSTQKAGGAGQRASNHGRRNDRQCDKTPSRRGPVEVLGEAWRIRLHCPHPHLHPSPKQQPYHCHFASRPRDDQRAVCQSGAAPSSPPAWTGALADSSLAPLDVLMPYLTCCYWLGWVYCFASC